MVWKLFLWSSLRKSYSICRENSGMAKFWPLYGQNLAISVQNSHFWVFLAYNFQTPLWIFLTPYVRKILVWRNFGPFKVKIWPFLAKKWQFWEFLTCNIQTLLLILLIFGTEVVLMVFFVFLFPSFFSFYAFPGNQSYIVLFPIEPSSKF